MLPRSRPASRVTCRRGQHRRGAGRAWQTASGRRKEEGQPDTSALTVRAHQVHPVIPCRRIPSAQAVGAETQAVVEGADTMVIEAADLVRDLGRS